MERNLDLPAGRLFCFSEGEYSDYSIIGHFVALKPLSREVFQGVKDNIIRKARSGEISGPIFEWYDINDESDMERIVKDYFLAEFLEQGLAVEVDSKEFHIGGYSRFALL